MTNGLTESQLATVGAMNALFAQVPTTELLSPPAPPEFVKGEEWAGSILGLLASMILFDTACEGFFRRSLAKWPDTLPSEQVDEFLEWLNLYGVRLGLGTNLSRAKDGSDR